MATSTLTPEQRTERARKAGLAAQAKMTPAERRESVQRAQLASAVSKIVDRAPELTEAQRAKLAALFSPADRRAA